MITVEQRDYVTQEELRHLIGKQHMFSWMSVKKRIDYLNSRNNAQGQMHYHLRQHYIGNKAIPFDIQVRYDLLSPAWKQYLLYRKHTTQPLKQNTL